MVTGIKKEELEIILKKYGIYKHVGESFGIIKFKTKSGAYDIALPRTEKSTGDKHTDFDIEVDHELDIKIDSSRRDSTINSMAIKIATSDINIESTQDIIDLHNGIDDLKNKLWRAVGDPNARFKEVL